MSVPESLTIASQACYILCCQWSFSSTAAALCVCVCVCVCVAG